MYTFSVKAFTFYDAWKMLCRFWRRTNELIYLIECLKRRASNPVAPAGFIKTCK